MKIGFVLDDGLDSTDGVQQYVITIGNWLKTQGHEVHYLVGQTKRSDLGHTHSLAKNVKVRFNRNRLSIPLPANKEAVRKLLALEKFDVLHVQMPYSPWLAARVIKAADDHTAVVGTFHIVPFSKHEARGNWLLGKYLSSTLQRFNSFLSVSTAAQAFMERSWGLKSRVMPNVVDVGRFVRHTTPDVGKRIVFLGRLVERKGAGYLLEAFAGLSDIPDLTLVIGGAGPLTASLKQQAKKLGVEQRVEFAGRIDEDKKADFLAGAELAVFPSTGGESFGIVLLEAMAARAGVVLGGDNPGYATVMGSLPDCLFDPHDTTQFSARLRSLLTDSSLRRELHEKQQRLIKQYDIAVVGPQLLNIYHEALLQTPNRATIEP